jgi:hypothetical protein
VQSYWKAKIKEAVMKKLLFISSLVISFSCAAQLSSLIVRNDTIFNMNPTTGVETQLTKLIPSQSGQSGKVLSTNGTNYVWITPFDGAYASLTGKPDLSGYASIATTVNGHALSANVTVTASDVSLGNVTNESKATMFTSPAFTGTATAANITATGNVLSSGGGLGYTTGNGSTVTQSGNKGSGVTINKLCGTITMVNSALAAAAEAKFTVTNSTVAATDVVIVNIKSGGTSGSYVIAVTAVGSGSFDITISNVSAGSLSEAVVINFAVIKGVAS